jgi:phage terminase small subunit
MSKGRPRKSPQEKLLEGSRARVQVEVFAPHGAPFVPEHLNDDAQACAEHIIRSFSMKHISSLDSYALAVFAAAWAWHKAAVHAMSAPGFQAVETRHDKNGDGFPARTIQMNQRAPFYVNQIVKGSKPADPPRSATFCCAA